MTAKAYAVALASLPLMGPGRLRALLARWSPEAAWRAILSGAATHDPRVAHACGRDIDKVRATWTRAAARLDPAQLLVRAGELGVAVHLLGEDGYPSSLAGDLEPPSVCFTLGEVAVLASPVRVAIVGTRAATAPGLELAKQLGHDLGEAGVSIVSGLARGIDGAAHAGALAASGGAPPIGVVGSGLDVPYPRMNRGLWESVGRHGVLLSEAPPAAPPSAWRFPARNRMIAALADLIVVVESRASGGSMLTVHEAALRGRQVMAVPGSVGSVASDGTNQLIYEGCCPVRDALDVLVALGLSTAERDRSPARRRGPGGTDGRVLELFDGGVALDIERVARLTSLPLAELALVLGRLEDGGWLARNGAWLSRA